MTHTSSTPPPPPADPRDAEVAQHLDALAEHDSGTMPTGLAERVLAATPAPVAGSAEPEVRTYKFSAFQRTSMALAAAAALAMLMLPVVLPKRTTTVPGPIMLVSDEVDAVDLFEMMTSSLASETDLDSLFEDAAAFDPAIEPDTAWLDETEAI